MLIEKPRLPIRELLLYGLWPSFLKILIYRLKGYRIGKGVSLGLGSVICGEQVEIGEHTSIGFLTIIRGKEIRLGSYVRIGAMTFFDTPHLEIGEGTNVNEQVFVGGLQYPDSRLTVGRNCSIMQMSFINPARPIVIGDDSVIGGHCLIFAHSSSLNQFEGYAVEFAPVEIGRGVGLAWRSFVLPGTKIGDGSMVGANSMVSGTIPPCSLAVGSPARIVGRPPVFPKPVTDGEKLEIFHKILSEMADYMTESGYPCIPNGNRYEVVQPNRGWHRGRHWHIVVADTDLSKALKELERITPDVFLSLCPIPDDVRMFLAARNIMWIDIIQKAQSRISNELGDEVVLFLKRFGVRPLRHPRPPAESPHRPS